jgi:hypothetical protein
MIDTPQQQLTRRSATQSARRTWSNAPRSDFVLVLIVAIAVGLVVWHATRANQARLGIRSRKGQIKGMRREIRKFALRGIIVLIVFIILVIAVVKH